MNDLADLLQHTPAASALLAAMVAFSLLALNRRPDLIDRHVFRPAGFVPRRDWPTVITSAFLHADLAHLLFNAFTFWAFAFPLERQIGTPRFVLLYAFGLLASAGLTWLRRRRQHGYSTLGASGAILAVLFASIVFNPTAELFIVPIPVPLPAPLFAVAYLGFTSWAARDGRGHVNHDAHLGGALAGLLFVWLVDPGAFGRAARMLLA